MADLSYESELVAASIQNRDVFRRVSKVGFTSEFFEETEFNRYIFDAARYLDRIGNDFSETAFEKIITSDPGLDNRGQAAYLSQLDSYLDRKVTDLELTLDKLKSVYKEKVLLNTVKNIAHAVKKKSDTEEIHQALKRALDRLDTNKVEFEMVDFYEDYADRNTTRAQLALSLGDRFKFWGNFSGFDHYFPRGIGGGTTTSVTGPTFVGKSVVLCNLAYLACHPNNGLDTIFIAAENMLSQVGDRFDAIFLDRPYGSLFAEDYVKTESTEDAIWFESKSKDPSWGKLILVKVPAKGFDANTLRLVLEAAVDRGYHPRVLIIDSPDHQQPITAYQQWHLNKGQVYYDNKGVIEEFGLIGFVSTPMKASATKSERPENEDVAGSIDISRVIDNQLMFNADKDDKLLGRARLVVTKNRDDGIVDMRNIAFRFKNSMVLIPFEDTFDDRTVIVRKPGDEGYNGPKKEPTLPERTFQVQT